MRGEGDFDDFEFIREIEKRGGRKISPSEETRETSLKFQNAKKRLNAIKADGEAKLADLEADIQTGDKILLVDEWSETGAQMKAAISLIEKVGGEVVGLSCFNIDKKVMADIEFSKLKLFSAI